MGIRQRCMGIYPESSPARSSAKFRPKPYKWAQLFLESGCVIKILYAFLLLYLSHERCIYNTHQHIAVSPFPSLQVFSCSRESAFLPTPFSSFLYPFVNLLWQASSRPNAV